VPAAITRGKENALFIVDEEDFSGKVEKRAIDDSEVGHAD
jgi:hypothetical protein